MSFPIPSLSIGKKPTINHSSEHIVQKGYIFSFTLYLVLLDRPSADHTADQPLSWTLLQLNEIGEVLVCRVAVMY